MSLLCCNEFDQVMFPLATNSGAQTRGQAAIISLVTGDDLTVSIPSIGTAQCVVGGKVTSFYGMLLSPM